MHVCVLVPRGAVALSCIEGSVTLLRQINLYLGSLGRAPRFEVCLVGITKEPQTYDGVFTVHPQASLAEVAQTDLIIIPAVNGPKDLVVEDNREFLPWIAAQYGQGAEVASLCVGAFLLAATGLLDHRKCTTHWSAADDFRRRFARVELVASDLITDEAGLYTSGGALSFWNLLIYLVQKHVGPEAAAFASHYFEVDRDRPSQSRFVIFQGQKDHGDQAVLRVQSEIEAALDQRLTLESLSSLAALTPRSLERRFKGATGNTVTEYLQRARVEAAKRALESGLNTVLEAMYQVGYSDPKAFRTAFRRLTGVSPSGYRDRYRRIGDPQLGSPPTP